jgi:hypothetical protein
MTSSKVERKRQLAGSMQSAVGRRGRTRKVPRSVALRHNLIQGPQPSFGWLCPSRAPRSCSHYAAISNFPASSTWPFIDSSSRCMSGGILREARSARCRGLTAHDSAHEPIPGSLISSLSARLRYFGAFCSLSESLPRWIELHHRRGILRDSGSLSQQ